MYTSIGLTRFNKVHKNAISDESSTVVLGGSGISDLLENGFLNNLCDLHSQCASITIFALEISKLATREIG